MSSPNLSQIYESSFATDPPLQLLQSELQHPQSQPPPTLTPSRFQGPVTRFTHLPHSSFLSSNGHLETALPSAPADSITHDPIHPVFRPQNFDSSLSIADQAYAAMRPALALATKLITTDEALGWWIHVLYGEARNDGHSHAYANTGAGAGTGGRPYLAPNALESNLSQAKADLAARWDALSSILVFYWRASTVRGRSVCATTASNALQVLCELRGVPYTPPSISAGAGVGAHTFSPRIGLSSIFLYHLISPVARQARTACEEMRVQMYLAVTLVHELAHVFVESVGFAGGYEPYIYRTDLMPEAGFSWEIWTFGVILGCAELSTLPFGTLSVRTWDMGFAFPSLKAPVHMDWVKAWFCRETWGRIGEVLRLDLLVPASAVGRPEVFIADRYFDGSWNSVLYRARGQIYEAVPFRDGDFGPGPDCPVEVWFSEVALQDARMAIENGVSSVEDFPGPFGNVYKHLQT
ncbi:hypothetical protein K491DRAFT_216684 [Lophiostoma macrostomum CBS 122681]|uniref:Uncharacterized protein n=1 Tax=Lophiostoma macrostomum CBS 122681 TaxID=1314788 RepID=A0A6A6TIK0_9PLEO|nr:hypothetical protein K491DRAFT_216684 [Lophiostoma macrostomum CBS 122681]